jgi:hypothetical protein
MGVVRGKKEERVGRGRRGLLYLVRCSLVLGPLRLGLIRFLYTGSEKDWGETCIIGLGYIR